MRSRPEHVKLLTKDIERWKRRLRSVLNILWWLSYVVIGIWLQYLVPGVDFLVPGLIVCLQENRKLQSGVFLAALLLIQEGQGSLAFGSGLLWYGFVVVVHRFVQGLFEEKNLLFILLLSLALGVWRYILVRFMPLLQEMETAGGGLFVESVLQAALTAPMWAVLRRLRRREKAVESERAAALPTT